MTFRIAWFVDDVEWARARQARRRIPPGSTIDVVYRHPVREIYSPLQFVYRDQRLFTNSPHRQAEPNWGRATADAATLDSPEYQWHNAGLHARSESLLDFSVQLSRIVIDGNLPNLVDGTTLKYNELYEQEVIWFTKMGTTVHITALFDNETPLAVPIDAFLVGSRQFLNQLVYAIEHRAPRLLDWESLSELRYPRW